MTFIFNHSIIMAYTESNCTTMACIGSSFVTIACNGSNFTEIALTGSIFVTIAFNKSIYAATVSILVHIGSNLPCITLIELNYVCFVSKQ